MHCSLVLDLPFTFAQLFRRSQTPLVLSGFRLLFSLSLSIFFSLSSSFLPICAAVSALHPVSLSFFPFQPLRARNLRVHAGPCVVFLAAAENLLLQHHHPNQHSHPGGCFPDGTLQFCARRRNAAQLSLRRRGGILHRAAAGPWRSDLTAPCLIRAPGLLFDCGDETDSLRDCTSVHGQDCCVCHTRASYQALKNIAILENFGN